MKLYQIVRRDFEELEKISELSDYMAVEERMLELMQTPNKRKAADIYHAAIMLWFQEHGVTEVTSDIAERHQFTS